MGALHSNRMAANTSPTEDEIDRFVELYEEIGTTSGVAEHDDVDWSRPTVTKHLKRRGAIEDNSSSDSGESEDESQPEPEPEPEPVDGGTMVEEVEESIPIEEQFSDILEDEPPSPNEILWDVLATDPDIKEKHAEYLRQFEDQYTVFSPDDVSGRLNDLKITNKRMTISRVVKNYRMEINRKLQKNEELAKREEWALLLTKTTGNPRYLREADTSGSVAQYDQAGPTIEGPADEQQGARGDQIQAPSPGGEPARGRDRSPAPQQGNRGERYGQDDPRAPSSAPAGQPPRAGGAGGQPPRGEGPHQARGAEGGEQGLNQFQQKILEMLEQQIDGQQPQQPSSPSESDSLSEQIQEIAEIQQTLDQMGGGDQQNEELTQAIQQINEQVDQKLARLEAKVSEMDGGTNPSPAPPTGGAEESGTIGAIAALAQQIEDPDVLSTVIESQMDPEVIKAKAETEEVKDEAKFKRALAEAVSPAATEKAIEAFSNLTSGLNSAAQQAQQPRQPQQPAQQPRQPQQQQGGQAQNRDVQVVEDDQQQAEEPAMSDPAEATEESSPLREQGEEELAETDTPDEADEEVEE